MTYSISLLSVPPVLFWEIVDAMKELGVDRTFLTTEPGASLPTTAIDMDGIALVANKDDDRDVLTGSSDLIDVVEQGTEEGFFEGFRVAKELQGQPYDSAEALRAWANYRPSPKIRNKIEKLYKEQ